MEDKGKRNRSSNGKEFYQFNWDEIWKRYRGPICLGLVGLILLGMGIFSFGMLGLREPEIEIYPVDEAEKSASVFIDLEGAVEKPGLYELPAEARINDLLVRAGGLSVEADRGWCEKNLNLAQPLKDGVKIFIPRRGEATAGQDSQVAGVSASSGKSININTASAAQLDTLWGIGSARAQSIIEGRPYQAIEELQNQKIIPSNVFERIKDQITVY